LAYDRQNEAGRRLQDLLSRMSSSEINEETEAERFAVERMAFLERELAEHIRHGAELEGLARLNPKSVTAETYGAFVAQARFLSEKSLLAAAVGAKLKSARAAYSSRDGATRARIREAAKPFELALLKIARLEDARDILPTGFAFPAAPGWLAKTSPSENSAQHIEQIVKGMREAQAQAKGESAAFASNQNVYREALAIERADQEAAEIGNRLAIGTRSLYYSGLAVTLAQGLGYNDRDFLEEVASLALLKLDDKARAFPKIPDRLKAPLALLKDPGSSLPMAYRDLRDVLRIVEAFASTNRDFSFGTPAQEVAGAIPSAPSTVHPDSAAQALGFLRLKACDRAGSLSRESALNAGRAAASWV
ncbi:MAG TPA: hypothetical protein VJB16_01185, partial [archaeon]|nr:hypothetical protein [archaeon]